MISLEFLSFPVMWDWMQGLAHTREVLYNWATSQLTLALSPSPSLLICSLFLVLIPWVKQSLNLGSPCLSLLHSWDDRANAGLANFDDLPIQPWQANKWSIKREDGLILQPKSLLCLGRKSRPGGSFSFRRYKQCNLFLLLCDYLDHIPHVPVLLAFFFYESVSCVHSLHLFMDKITLTDDLEAFKTDVLCLTRQGQMLFIW